MDKVWQEMYDAAKSVLCERRISDYVTCGEVSAAVRSKSGRMQSTLSISCSPFVIILKMAFLSAHIPRVEQVSTHTPVYILPDFDRTAAETSPQVT